MAEYIEREAFKAEIRRLSTHYLNEWDTLGVLAAADRIPAADVRPVVTCGRCKYADSFSPACTESTLPLKCLSVRYGGVYPDWFCEHGEKREES